MRAVRRPSLADRLRAELVLVCAVALCLVLGGIVVVTSVIGHYTATQNADAVLDAIVSGGGTGQVASPQTTVEQYGKQSQETLYEARYFSVRLDENGSVRSVYLDETSSVTEDQARDMVGEMQRHNTMGIDRGTIGDYRYRIVGDDGGSLVVFLDRGRQNEMLKSLIITIGSVSVAAACLTLVVVLLLSRRIVRPVVESNLKQRQFVTDAGHDIKTPLTIISADADVLRMDLEGADPHEDLQWVDDIKDQVATLTDLTDRLIYISKMEEGEDVRARSVEFSVSEVVERQLASFRSRSKTSGRTLEGDVQPDVRMCGDEQAIAKMVSALLDNAFKYSDEGGTIRLSLKGHPRTVRLTAYNTAEGIDRRDVAHWFDRFYQEDQSRTHREGGFGIGLSMVSAVAAAHGGKVEAQASKDGTAVSICVALPTHLSRQARRKQ